MLSGKVLSRGSLCQDSLEFNLLHPVLSTSLKETSVSIKRIKNDERRKEKEANMSDEERGSTGP